MWLVSWWESDLGPIRKNRKLSFNFKTVKVKESSPWMEWCAFLRPSTCWHLASRMLARMSLELVQEERQRQTVLAQTLLTSVSSYIPPLFPPSQLAIAIDERQQSFRILDSLCWIFIILSSFLHCKNYEFFLTHRMHQKIAYIIFTCWCPSFHFIIKIN